jgi:hypothetical protein
VADEKQRDQKVLLNNTRMGSTKILKMCTIWKISLFKKWRAKGGIKV